MVDILVLGPIDNYLPLFCGALIKLMSVKLDIKVYCGCSLGSLIASMLVVGYTPKEILLELIDNKDISLDDVSNIINIKNRIQQLFIDKIGIIPTLRQLYYATGLSLVTTVFNLNYGEVELFSYDTTPELSTDEAVIMSMNVPLLFYDIRYRGCSYVDGSIGNPYPVNYFDNGINRVLGISYKSSITNTTITTTTTTNPARYLYRIIGMLSNHIGDGIRRSTSDKCHHLILNVSDKDSIESMIISGYNQTSTFINNIITI
jgi:predicted acylesterase/phospholipase RssA